MITTHIGKVAIRDIAARFGTPTYVYDSGMIERRVRDLKGFPLIRYAQKANSNIAVLSLLRKLGVKVDAVSAGEIHRAFRAGYEPKEIVYTSDIIDHDAMALVEKFDIRVNCGSPDMVEQLGKRCPGRKITLRINPGFGHGHTQKTNTGGEQSKHGIWHEQLAECHGFATDNRLRVTGLHMHIGSGTDLEHLAHVCDAMTKAALTIGKDLEIVSAGGGLPVPYRPTDKPLDVPAYTQMWLKTHENLEKTLGRRVDLEVEPGRYPVCEAGFLIAEIRAVKQMGNNLFYLLNAGFNNLARPILYGSYHPMSVCPLEEASTETKQVVVGGPLCESGDIFTQREGGFVETRELPVAKVGDLFVIHNAGAYSFVMGSNYNSMPFASEVMIWNNAPFEVRKRQPIEDLTSLESIPWTYASVIRLPLFKLIRTAVPFLARNGGR